MNAMTRFDTLASVLDTEAAEYITGARSWRALSTTLEEGPRRTNKAAIYAAALSMGMDPYGRHSYADARNYLASVSRSARNKLDATDGVPALVDWRQSRTLHGVTVTPIVILHADKLQVRQPAFLVRGMGRTFHTSDQRAPRNISAVRAAVNEALAAWTQQRKAKRAAVVRDDQLSRVSVLVRVSDSLAAGNCEPGTLAFQHEQGWSGRWYVPAPWLDATGRPAAKNAARVAEAAVLRQMAG